MDLKEDGRIVEISENFLHLARLIQPQISLSKLQSHLIEDKKFTISEFLVDFNFYSYKTYNQEDDAGDSPYDQQHYYEDDHYFDLSVLGN